MTTKQPTCSERIAGELAGRLTDFRAYQDENVRENGNDDLGPVHEYPLAVTVAKTYRIELSTGGPGDWLEVLVEDGGIPGMERGFATRIEYHFQDWGDHASKVLTGREFDDALTFAQNFIEELS